MDGAKKSCGFRGNLALQQLGCLEADHVEKGDSAITLDAFGAATPIFPTIISRGGGEDALPNQTAHLRQRLTQCSGRHSLEMR